MARILIAEDEKSISDLIRLNLELVGHECFQCFDGESALNEAYSGKYDLIILDVMLPKISGFEVMEELKGESVIFVTAKSNLYDRIRGLRLGADDYIVKPFEILELVERVKAVLRRTKKGLSVFSFDGIEINFVSKQVFKNGEEVILTHKEYALFEALINNRNIALSREKLLDMVWDFDYEGDTRTVDVHVQRIRQKLGIEGRLKTVYKTGYRLEI